MKKVLIVGLVLALLSVLVLPSVVLAKPPFVPEDHQPGTPIDYNRETAYYNVVEGEIQGVSYILVMYKDVVPFKNNPNKFVVATLGYEYWNENVGIWADTFPPLAPESWNYPYFPELKRVEG